MNQRYYVMMKKYCLMILLAALLLCGCGAEAQTDTTEAVSDTAEETKQQTEEKAVSVQFHTVWQNSPAH